MIDPNAVKPRKEKKQSQLNQFFLKTSGTVTSPPATLSPPIQTPDGSPTSNSDGYVFDEVSEFCELPQDLLCLFGEATGMAVPDQQSINPLAQWEQVLV